MFDHIDATLKNLSKFIFYLGILVSIIWFLLSVIVYFKNREYIEYASIYGRGLYEELIKSGDSAYYAKIGIMYSIVSLFSSIISSIFIYGFGEVIGNLKDIRNKMYNNEEKKDIAPQNFSNSSADLLAASRVSSTGNWECKKCGELNPSGNLFCKSCGIYK